ncbi:MAG: hypothetical protein M1820_002333 [Bogoriella megaspora]|nr:MAG: hypothetical protein M1820_002333 [Bogoriella megaspora]
MPQPGLPPTPASSTDIAGKQNGTVPYGEPAFALPPAAMASNRQFANAASRASMSSSISSSNNSSDSSWRPMSPPSPNVAQRKRPLAASRGGPGGEDFNLPPPPQRTRKIIQMKPRAQEEKTPKAAPQQSPKAAERPESSSAPSSAKAGPSSNLGGRKRQATGTTAAGRKIARKTAHSLIERRRRSKMNEEFGVLKDMIPACAGQEMHKLAILQASIEYLRYLEKCVADLKASNRSQPKETYKTASAPRGFRVTAPGNDEEEEEEEDEEMTDQLGSGASTPSAPPISTVPAQAQASHRQPYPRPSMSSSSSTRPRLPSISPILSASSSTNVSPAIHASDRSQANYGSRHYSLSSYASNTSSAIAHSALPSPAFDSLSYQRPSGSSGSLAEFRLASPALGPQPERRENKSSSPPSPVDADRALRREYYRPPYGGGLSEVGGLPRADGDPDQQATAALLMLNADRRSWDVEKNRGMSVRDLLSG